MKLSFLLILFSLSAQAITVGSKKFTESVILGEITTQLLNAKNISSTHQRELGGTQLLWNALIHNNIQAYPEYTGTLAKEVLKISPPYTFDQLESSLKKFGIGMTRPLGFQNTYALGMKRSKAQSLGIQKISDLKKHPDLKLGFGEEFKNRPDGWPGLKQYYRLPHLFQNALDHDIAYRALNNDDIHLMDVYTTDAEIAYYDIQVLKDDLTFFPEYQAILLYRLDLPSEASQVLHLLSGKINEQIMISLNKKVKIDSLNDKKVAHQFLKKSLNIQSQVKSLGLMQRLWHSTLSHLSLVCFSLILAIIVAIPLGILASKYHKVGSIILSTTGIIQTIPALALLVIMIEPLNWLGLSGIGKPPALVALFLYSLLPIVRNTHSGFRQIPQHLQETSYVLGLGIKTRLLKIELPLALPSILSGIKTSAVLNIGFATLGALVGAGGFGQPILTGIRLDDYSLILEGAIPAAMMAIVAQLSFEALEKLLVSKGLQSS